LTRVRNDIQGLRGIAVIAVVLSHTYSRIFPNGYLGVDVFFVISGFVLAPVLIDIATETNNSAKILKVRKFIRRRIFRLLPALVVFWALISLAFVLFADIHDLRIISNQVILSIFQAGNIGSHYLQGSYFQDFSNPWVHTWSLSVEFQLYLVLCFIGLLSRKKKHFTKITLLLAVISVTLFLVAGPNNKSLWLDYYSPVTRVWEVFFGTILYVILHQKQGMSRFNFSIPAQFILIGIALFPTPLHRLTTTVVIIALTGLLLARNRDNKDRILKNRFLIGIGNRSYSIYLVHVPVYYILERFPILEKLKDNNSIKILYLVITYLVADQLYNRIEQKYREPNISIVKKRNLSIFTITAVMAASVIHFSSAKITDPIINEGGSPPWISETGCQIFGNLEIAHKVPCPLYKSKNQSGRVVLLLGDSHAAMYKNTLTDKARESETNLYASTQYGCPFFINQQTAPSSPGAKNCLEHNLSILKWITSAKPSSIILSSRPGYVLEGFNFTDAQLLDYEVKAMTAIMKLDIDVIKLGPVPERERYKSIAQKYYPSLFEPSKFQLSINQNEWWIRKNSAGNFKFVNVFQNICNSNCPREINNRSIYFDSNHLNDYGARIALKNFNLE
jgi:peptidoglycan/LPS O-acetylase OafA/YrhL